MKNTTGRNQKGESKLTRFLRWIHPIRSKVIYKYLIWRAYLKGVQIDTRFETFAVPKEKWIQGTVTGFDLTFVTYTNYDLDFRIEWDEPLQGVDPDYYTAGWYKISDIGKPIRFYL